MDPYPITERDRCAKFGDVTKNGVVFDWDLVNVNGGHFVLIRESRHSNEDIQLAEDCIRRDRDVVRLSVRNLEDSPEDLNEMTFVHVDCSQCGTLYKFPCTKEQFKLYYTPDRKLIQDIFPEIANPARAVLTQGNVCALCLPQLQDVTPVLTPYIR